MSNLIIVILVLVYQPFRIEDCIEVSSYKGLVKDINFHYKILESEKNNFINTKYNVFQKLDFDKKIIK